MTSRVFAAKTQHDYLRTVAGFGASALDAAEVQALCDAQGRSGSLLEKLAKKHAD